MKEMELVENLLHVFQKNDMHASVKPSGSYQEYELTISLEFKEYKFIIDCSDITMLVGSMIGFIENNKHTTEFELLHILFVNILRDLAKIIEE